MGTSTSIYMGKCEIDPKVPLEVLSVMWGSKSPSYGVDFSP